MIKKERFKLKNGSPLVAIFLPNSPSVTFMVNIRSGPRFDPIDKPGLSHFVEHLLFRGTKNYPTSRLLNLRLESCGAVLDAFTYRETSTYWIKSARENLSLAVEVLTDQLQHSLFHNQEIESEKNVVMEEIKMVKNNPESYIWETWAENIWKETSLGGSFFGDNRAIESFTREDLLEFVQRNYLVNNTVFLVSGNFSFEKLKSLMDAHITDYFRKGSQVVSPISVKEGSSMNIVYQNSESVTAAYGFPTVGILNTDSHILEVIEYLLGRGLGSRLSQEISEKGLTYSIEAYSGHLSDTGYFVMDFTALPKNLNRILKIINSNLKALIKGDFTAEELDRAKKYLIGTLSTMVETSYDFASWYAYQEVINPRKVLDLEEKFRIIQGVSRDDVVRVTKTYFNFNNWHLSLIGKIKKEKISIDF